MMNVLRWGLWSFLGAYLMALSLALPSSLVDEIKSSEMRTNKGVSLGSMKSNKYILGSLSERHAEKLTGSELLLQKLPKYLNNMMNELQIFEQERLLQDLLQQLKSETHVVKLNAQDRLDQELESIINGILVKRAHPDHAASNENVDPVNYFNKHTSAIKRGTNLKSPDAELSGLPEWDADQIYSNADFNMDNIQSGLFNSPNLPLDDKTIAEYEKGYRYGANKDKLDEALENAVLKSEAYREPYNQYRFYDNNRRRRDTIKQMRPKRNVDLTPEEVLALLTLYENNRAGLKENDNYRQPIFKYGKGYGVGDIEDFDTESNDESWLNGPVYPHASIDNDISDNYLYDYVNGAEPDYKARWGGFGDAKKKRFIIAKKRTSDPTRMIRYINGPSQNDFDTLSNLINQREPKLDIPVYHRKVL